MASAYDPQKRREYYLRTRQLKGRKKGSEKASTGGGQRSAPKADKAKSRERVVRLTQKLRRLQTAKKEAAEALREARKGDKEQRDNARRTEKKNSDGKTTAKERQSAKEYRDRNKSKIAAKRKSSSKSESKSVSDMSVDELKDRVKKINDLISKTKEQIKKANSLSHSITVDENNIVHNGLFDR